MSRKENMKIRFFFGVKCPPLGKRAVALLKEATNISLLALTENIQNNGIDLSYILKLAETARLLNPIKYGSEPLTGKTVQEPRIFEGIEVSESRKEILSAYNPLCHMSKVDNKPHDLTTYFKVTNKSRSDIVCNDDDDDDEDYDDEGPAAPRAIVSKIKVTYFFYGITGEEEEVRIPSSSSSSVMP